MTVSDSHVFRYGCFVLIVILALVGYFVFAYAQIDVQSKLQELLKDENVHCDIWQTRDFLYQPVEFRADYENTTDTIVRLAKEDSGSKPDYRGDEDNFYFNSHNYTDTYTIELLLDYTNKPTHVREVSWELHTDDGQLTSDGIWSFNSTEFCRVLVFKTSVKPQFPTIEEVAKKQRDATTEILTEWGLQLFNISNTQLWVIAVSLGTAGVAIISAIIYWDNLRRVSKSVTQPMNAYGELNKKNKRIVKNMQILSEFIMSTEDRIKKLGSRFDNAVAEFRYFYTDIGLLSKQMQDISKHTEEPTTSKVEPVVEPEVEPVVEPEVKQDEPPSDNFASKFSKISKIIKHEHIEEKPLTEEQWREIYRKQSREDNEELHDDLTLKYGINPTNGLAIQLTALRKVLFEQV